MWRLLSLVGIAFALRSDFDFVRSTCTCDYADPGPNFLPDDTIWDKEDNRTTMPFQCPRRKIRNKYAVMKFIVNVEEEIRRNCNVADYCRRVGRRTNHDKLKMTPKFDYIVVGSGAAGAVIAGRLAAYMKYQNKTVLLLEAGEVDPIISRVPSFYKYFRYHNATDWNYRTQYAKQYCRMSFGRCRLNHGKSLGGSTIFNDMIYQRGHRFDCEHWFKALGRRFKTCRDFEPYYLRFENNLDTRKDDYLSVHGTDGPMPVQQFQHRTKLINRLIKAAIDAGFLHLKDMLNPESLSGGLGIAHSFQANGQRYTPARAYLHRSYENLLIVLRAQVIKVLFKGIRAYAVQYALNEDWDNLMVVEATEQIILSAGVFNTPKILMLSGIGPKKELERLKIPLIKDYPIGAEVKFHYGFRMRYAIGYAADHFRDFAWKYTGNIIAWWLYLWENAMVYLKPSQKMLDHYWVDMLDDSNIDQYLAAGKGSLGSNGLTQLVGMFTTTFGGDKSRPDIQVIFEGMQADCSRTKKQNLTLPFKHYYPVHPGYRVYNTTKYRVINNTIYYWRSHRNKKLRVNADLHAVASRNIDVFIHLLDPRSTGRMTLNSTNPGDPPLIYPNFFDDHADMTMLFEGALIVDKIMLTKSMSGLRMEMPVDYFRICSFSEYYKSHNVKGSWYTPDGYYFNIFKRDLNITFISCLIRQYTVARYHQQGTVPLGKAINEKYQLIGFDGLRVVDGSIISGPISGSPQGTIMMFAENVVDIIVKELNPPNLESISFIDY